MEEMNRKLAEELAKTRREHNEQMRLLLERFGELSVRPGERNGNSVLNTNAVGGIGPSGDGAQSVVTHTPVPDYTEGQLAPNTPAPGYPLDKDRPSGRSPLTGSFGPGFQFETEDEELRLLIHYESQIEGRIWAQGDQIPANSGFFLPRQRIFFTGNITKPIEYEFSINRGSGGSLNLLNAYINIHFDDRFELRFGRFFTPLPYDQYAISNYWLPTPERSLFTTNVGLNRQFGLMGWGYLFDKQLDYAAGVFNGSRNSFESLNNAVDLVAYLNARPFQQSESFRSPGSSISDLRSRSAARTRRPCPCRSASAEALPMPTAPGPVRLPSSSSTAT